MRANPPRGRFPNFPTRSNRAWGSHPPLPRYKVMLVDTAGKDLMFIVRTVMELTRFGEAEARHRMWQAYHNGHSIILVTHLERAELYAEQFADRGLAVTLEPV